MRKGTLRTIAPAALMLLGFGASPAFPQSGAVATQPYKLTAFATAPSGLSAPDSIAVVNDHVFARRTKPNRAVVFEDVAAVLKFFQSVLVNRVALALKIRSEFPAGVWAFVPI